MKPVLQTVISGQLYLGMHTHVALLSRRLARVRTRYTGSSGTMAPTLCHLLPSPTSSLVSPRETATQESPPHATLPFEWGRVSHCDSSVLWGRG